MTPDFVPSLSVGPLTMRPTWFALLCAARAYLGGEPTDRPARQLSAEQRRALVLAALSGEGPVALARCRDTSDYRTWKPKDKALGDAQEQAECRWRMWGLEAVGEATM
jgi:hypothetical protein